MKDFRFHGNPIKVRTKNCRCRKKIHIYYNAFIFKIAWAMNKGVKDRFKDYWDADHGCTYIPYSELKDIPNLTALAEGGTIDEESMPAFLKRLILSCYPILFD